MDSNSNTSVPKIVGVIVAILVCCACAVILAAAALVFYEYRSSPVSDTTSLPSPALDDTATPPPTIELTRPPIDSVTPDTLQALIDTNVPENDPYELACRLEDICDVSKTVPGKSYKLGDEENFWISDSDTAEHHQITATLLYITPHSYFWAESGATVDTDDMKKLMDAFEEKIYPTDREFFGSEWTPGVDEDPHIFVIYASGLGSNIGGYFNSSDSFNPLVKEFSNGHETYMLSTTQDLTNEYTYGILAHEFVHMIQFASDRNDVSWLGEGFAEVGVFLNGYDVGGADWEYTRDPDLQLNAWADNSSPDFGSHYGQSFLYLTYFLDRFGEEATQALTNNLENNISSVDDTLAQLGITDPLTGETVTADDVFMDWAAALFLKDENVGDGRYTYHNYPGVPQTEATEVIATCPRSASGGSVNQYGIDYIQIECEGDFTLGFSGSTAIGLLPTTVNSGDYAFWSNKGDESDMTLTREFDLTAVSGPVAISYWMWHDIEEDWDYVFVEASTDGETWEILTTPSGTDKNPSGNSYGWGYTGATGDWIQESVDLSQFAGQKVQIRFEYITDAAINGEGLLLDDVQVDAINYQSDFEADNGGWVANGFVRVENVLPQTYRLSLIIKGDTTTVTPIELNADNTIDIPLSLKSGDEAILIVTGTTRFTTIPAAYQVEIK